MKPRYRAFTALMFVAFLPAVTSRLPAEEKNADKDLDARIAELIEQLGSKQYATREKAQSQIRAIGLSAFDALLEARHHRDIEVARRVRYLLRGLPVDWVRDADPVAVKSRLRTYGQEGRDERISRMEELADLEDAQGLEALCRIMRFEVDPILSKKAALQILAMQLPDGSPSKQELAERIRDAVGTSRRPAATWALAYADTLVAPDEALEKWRELTKRELDTLASNPEETQAEVVRELLRWHVDQLREFGHDDEATTNIGKIVDLVEGNYRELADVVDWALDREAWFVPEELAERFPSEFQRQPVLVYRLAEARRKRGDREAAEEAAKKAFAIAPSRLKQHRLLGRYLRKRLLYDWAETELRYVIETAKERKERDHELDARNDLAQMLFDLARAEKAADVLEPAIAVTQETRGGFSYTVAELQSWTDYYRAMHYAQGGDHEKQKKLLKRAFENNPANIDIIIAMYRIPNPGDAWRDETLKRLETAVGERRGRMRQLEQALLETNDDRERDLLKSQLAQQKNELAWLVSNTEGDYEEALACSRESLRLSPGNWAYLDTLGRCYYALGEFEKAMEKQKEAVDGAPYMQQMRRQLELFETALKESRRNAS